MSVTVTYSTMDHRYFMRRTKSEIIARMEFIRGRIYTPKQYKDLSGWTKDALASKAVRLIRSLPPALDPVDALIDVITAELRRQSEADGPTPYVDLRVSEHVKLDGHFDLKALAQAIIRETRP
jgi:hypothetical protein